MRLKPLWDFRGFFKSWRPPDRPVQYRWWPIRIGWCVGGNHALLCWHGWPDKGAEIWPDATYKTCGWTLHIGYLKIKFGRE